MRKIIVLWVILLPLFSIAQTEYNFLYHRNIVNNGYNFILSVPDTYEKQSDEMPVVLFLHGASLCGSDLNRVRKYGCLDAISMGRDINAIVIAPQNPGGSWAPAKILNVINWVTAHYSIDTNRIYVLGMSLGGYGTFDVAATYPEKFAAAMAICGGSSRKEFCGLNKLPLWIIHGTADRDVPISHSDRIVNAIKACGSADLLRYDRLPGVNHSQPAKIFYLPETYEWLFSHSKTDSVRQVNKYVQINTHTMGKAYQNINRTANKIVVVDSKKSTKNETADTIITHEERMSECANEKVQEAKSPQANGKPSVHIVKRGDTLFSIARKHHTTVDKLCKINRIKENSILSIGQKIKIR